MEDFITWIKNDASHPITKAATTHFRLVNIHPFRYFPLHPRELQG
jgi:Fic family protein